MESKQRQKLIRNIKRVNTFLYCPVTGKSFEAISFPLSPGDGCNGFLSRMRRMIKAYKVANSGILRRHHGALSHNLVIKVKYVFK
jgi:hypothetical protein